MASINSLRGGEMEVVPLLDAGISRLQNPSGLLHGLLSLSELRYWIWAALLLASLAAFASLVLSARLVILRPRSGKSATPQSHLSFSTDDDSDDDSWSSSSEDEAEEEEDEVLSSSEREDEPAGHSRNHAEDEGQSGEEEEKEGVFSWSEIFSGGIVKAWDGLGLGFDRPSGLVSLLDVDRWDVLRSIPAGNRGIPAAYMPSPAVVLSAAAAVRAWDVRIPGSSAAAEWRPRRRRGLAAIGGCGDGRKVYVRDDVGAVAEVDLRNVRDPVGKSWWDADAEMVQRS